MDDWNSFLFKTLYAPIFIKGRKKDPGNYWLLSLISAPGKIVGQILLEAMLGNVEDSMALLRTSPAWPA